MVYKWYLICKHKLKLSVAQFWKLFIWWEQCLSNNIFFLSSVWISLDGSYIGSYLFVICNIFFLGSFCDFKLLVCCSDYWRRDRGKQLTFVLQLLQIRILYMNKMCWKTQWRVVFIWSLFQISFCFIMQKDLSFVKGIF